MYVMQVDVVSSHVVHYCMFCSFRYGAKIRFPHALVMTFLFHGGR